MEFETARTDRPKEQRDPAAVPNKDVGALAVGKLDDVLDWFQQRYRSSSRTDGQHRVLLVERDDFLERGSVVADVKFLRPE